MITTIQVCPQLHPRNATNQPLLPSCTSAAEKPKRSFRSCCRKASGLIGLKSASRRHRSSALHDGLPMFNLQNKVPIPFLSLKKSGVFGGVEGRQLGLGFTPRISRPNQLINGIEVTRRVWHHDSVMVTSIPNPTKLCYRCLDNYSSHREHK